MTESDCKGTCRVLDMFKLFGVDTKQTFYIYEITYDKIIRKTKNNMYFKIGDICVWIPYKGIRGMDFEENKILIDEESARKIGLI